MLSAFINAVPTVVERVTSAEAALTHEVEGGL